MSAYSMITNLLSGIASSAPLLIVWIAGAVAAVVRRRYHPRASMFVLGGCGILIVTSLGMLGLYTIMPLFYDTLGYQTIGWVMTGTRVINAIVSAAGHALIILGAFIDRPAVPQAVG